MHLQTKCSCGTEFEIEQSKRAAYCPKCDRGPVYNPLSDSPLSELGKELISLAAGMNMAITETYKILDPKKQCQGGCGRSFPKSQMHSGIWCSECYETKEETN